MGGRAGGVLPPSLPSGYSPLRKPSFLGEDRQFLEGDSWLEAPANPPSPLIGRGWVINVPSGFLEQSLHSWLLKIML